MTTTTNPATASTVVPLSEPEGLTVRQVIRQSMLCHPDWDAIMHTQYLDFEGGITVHPELVAYILHGERAA